MAKKTSKHNIPDWATVIFWIVGAIAVVGIFVGIIIFAVNSIRDIGNTISGETTTTTTIVSEDLPISDPGVAVGAVDMIGHMSNHVNMDEIDWETYDDKLVATPNVDVQIGNDKIRYGNDVFMTKVELPGSVPELNLLTHVDKQYDYVDQDGLGRSFTYAGQYAYNAGDDFLIAGSEETLGKRYLVVTDDRVFTVKVDTTEASDDVHTISNVLYIYEIADGYIPEVYPKTDGKGNIIA